MDSVSIQPLSYIVRKDGRKINASIIIKRIPKDQLMSSALEASEHSVLPLIFPLHDSNSDHKEQVDPKAAHSKSFLRDEA